MKRIDTNQNGLERSRRFLLAVEALRQDHTTKMNTILTTIKTTMTTAAKDVAPAWGVTDLDGFLAALMERMEVAPTKKVATKKEKEVLKDAPKEEEKKEESVKSDGGKKRVVSKKMKETFMTLPGASEEKLNEIVKAYKEATEVTSFDAFARSQLGLDAPAEKKKVVKAKKEKSGRLDKWTPTSTKLFKTIVEESGGAVTDDLKKEFVTWLDALADEEFANASIQGHMRAFVTTKLVKKDEPAPKEDGDEDEDLEEIDFEGESLLIGVKTGKIYQPTDAGDVLVGYAGKGRFASVKKPE